MYAVLLLAALSLVILVLQDVLTAVEPEGGELHHLFVFDLAWPLFLIAALATLIAGGGAAHRPAAIGCSADSIRSLGGGLSWGGSTHHHRHGKPAAPGA